MSELPDYPHSRRWRDLLHWAVQVMDTEDPDLSFAASLLAQAVDKDGLTQRQVVYAGRIVERLHRLWARGELVRQMQPDMDAAPRDAAGKVVLQ